MTAPEEFASERLTGFSMGLAAGLALAIFLTWLRTGKVPSELHA